MLAAPFFTSGRAAILPSITTAAELTTANSLVQTTQWGTQIVGTMLAGYAVGSLGYAAAFALNAAAFLFSAFTTWAMRLPDGGFRAARSTPRRAWADYREGLRYIRSTPLICGIAFISIGWAAGGGAAQLLFVLFGDHVFHRGAQGVGAMAGFAGIGLLLGGIAGHFIGARVNFAGYKRAVTLSYISHGAIFVAFALTEGYLAALILLAASRVGMAITTVLNTAQLLHHTPDSHRGRVFGTLESLRWSVMIVSMSAASLATEVASPRAIGVVAGLFGVLTAAGWAYANHKGWLRQPTA
jgi:MFS family permease